ncbi:MAG: D-tyrosyl-tRNA(Tyr) deacylase [Candidatus Eisenbacteria bacterium]|nr:D-tyrosyl-tRNA(Tyr) deacylase [Candidatus Eisenbacteria bacterium]
MRALVQRVSRASVTVDGRVTGVIERGLLVLLGATHADSEADGRWLATKLAGLRVFPDDAGKMNRDVREASGAALVVPQFTLYGDARYGRRPEFTAAARPEIAEPLYEKFCEALAAEGVRVERGVFRAHMEVELLNDGPVTLWIESPASDAGGARPGGAGGTES